MLKNLNNNQKLIISHVADIDGAGSVVLALEYFKGNIDYILCEAKELESIFDMDLNYEEIFICDLPLFPEAIAKINSKYASKIKHFDHHELQLDEVPPYYNTHPTLNNRLSCGTELFYNYLLSLPNSDILTSTFYQEFVEAVRQQDNWDFGTFENLGRNLAAIHALLGPTSYLDFVLNLDKSNHFIIPKIYLDILKSQEDVMNRYIANALNNIYITNIFGYRVGVSISEQYRSNLGHAICKSTGIDFILIINFSRMSCSLRTTKDDIDLSKIAKKFHKNGGGHPKASGFTLDQSSLKLLKPIINEYLENIK